MKSNASSFNIALLFFNSPPFFFIKTFFWPLHVATWLGWEDLILWRRQGFWWHSIPQFIWLEEGNTICTRCRVHSWTNIKIFATFCLYLFIVISQDIWLASIYQLPEVWEGYELCRPPSQVYVIWYKNFLVYAIL